MGIGPGVRGRGQGRSLTGGVGCSDVELLRYHEAGGCFDYLRSHVGHGCGPVTDALESLASYYSVRVWESPCGYIDRFVRERGLMEAATGHPRIRKRERIGESRAVAAESRGSIQCVRWPVYQIAFTMGIVRFPVLGIRKSQTDPAATAGLPNRRLGVFASSFVFIGSCICLAPQPPVQDDWVLPKALTNIRKSPNPISPLRSRSYLASYPASSRLNPK